jgi:hypothetical protein
MTEKVPMGIVLQMVQQNDDKHEAGHTRLRLDYRELERRVMAIERAYTDTVLDFTRTKTAIEERANLPIDVGKIMFNPRMVLAIVGLVATIVTGNWLTNQPIREQLIRNDERTSNMAAEIVSLKQELKAGLELRRMEIATLQKSVDDKLRAK